MMVVFLWGVLGVSLLLCLLVGVVLCMMSLAYVLILKNNRPEHYDTDFFESALVEAGVLPFVFSPRVKPATNPFLVGGHASVDNIKAATRASRLTPRVGLKSGAPATRRAAPAPTVAWREREDHYDSKGLSKNDPEPTESVPTRDCEHLQEQLAATEELLEEAYAESGRRDL